MEYQISSRGLSNFANSNLPQDFTFIVGDKEYKCNKLQADLISSKVAELHVRSPNENKLVVDVEDRFGVFQLFINMMNGEEVEIEPSKIQFVRRIAKFIGNQELIDRFSYINKDEELTTENVVQILEEKNELNLEHSEEVELLAKNFYGIDLETMENMDVNLLDEVLSHPELILDDESITFDFIYDQVVNNSRDYIRLFKYLYFQNISVAQVEKFLNIIDVQKDITPELFEKIMERLVQPLKEEPNLEKYTDRYSTELIDCTMKHRAVNMFCGIMNYFIKTGIDLSKTEVIKITAVGSLNYSNVSSLFKQDPKTHFGINESPGSCIMINFKNYKVHLTGYSIKSSTKSHWDSPHSWELQGSNDEKNWEVIDEKRNNNDLCGDEKTHHWKCEKSKAYQYIRWLINSKNRNSSIFIRQFELFGYLKDASVKE